MNSNFLSGYLYEVNVLKNKPRNIYEGSTNGFIKPYKIPSAFVNFLVHFLSSYSINPITELLVKHHRNCFLSAFCQPFIDTFKGYSEYRSYPQIKFLRKLCFVFIFFG